MIALRVSCFNDSSILSGASVPALLIVFMERDRLVIAKEVGQFSSLPSLPWVVDLDCIEIR